MDGDEVGHLTKEDPVNALEVLKEKSGKDAIDDEMNQMVKNKIWILVTPPKSCKLIGLKWVFKIKRDSIGHIIKYKAQLVMTGDNVSLMHSFSSL